MGSDFPIEIFIEKRWDELTGNARNGSHETVHDWATAAGASYDGHLDDCDSMSPKILYLPNDFVTPGGRFTVQFYWDSYFILLALLRTDRINLVQGMIENMFHCVAKHGCVIANRKRWATGSQLPFLADITWRFFEMTKDVSWLDRALPFVIQEYESYWCAHPHVAFENLSRFHCPVAFPQEAWTAITLDSEATWDLTPRFDEDVLDIIPIDLNTNLWMYEKRIQRMYAESGREKEARVWLERANERCGKINNYLWDETTGMYLDFDFRQGKRKPVRSLAAYVPMYFGIASQEQAERLVKNLSLFETDYGLSTCDQNYGFTDRQWNHPVGWAPLHWFVCKGLWDYGYRNDARRIAEKWNNLVYAEWKRTGEIFEKYNVVSGSSRITEDPRYTNQTGFGWTNGVYMLLKMEILDND